MLIGYRKAREKVHVANFCSIPVILFLSIKILLFVARRLLGFAVSRPEVFHRLVQ